MRSGSRRSASSAWRACSTPRASGTSWPSAPGRRRARVEALTLGSHGDTMVPLSRTATIGGRPAGEVLGEAALERGRPAHARRRRRGRAAAPARLGLLGAERRRDADGARDPARRAGRAADRGATVGRVRHRRRVRRRAGAARPRRRLRDRHRAASTRPRSAALRAAAEEVRSRVADLHELGLMPSDSSSAPERSRIDSSPTPPAALVDAVRGTLL